MEKSAKLLVLLVIVHALSSCSGNTELRAWYVTKDIVVYKDFHDDAQVAAFELKMGDVCVLGEQRMEKAFRYTEVLCPGRGYGWAADYAFAPVTANNAATPLKK